MATPVVISKIAMRCDYDANLRVYTRMDEVALRLRSDFEHWERQPLSIEMRNPADHSRFSMQFSHCYFECEWPPNTEAVIQKSAECFDRALRKFEVQQIKRLGLLLMSIQQSDESFPQLTSRMDRKLYRPFSEMSPFVNCQLVDVAYGAIVKDRGNSTWNRLLNIGPMTAEEWITKNPIDARLYDPSGESPLMSVRSRLPGVLSFVSVDAFTEGVSWSSVFRELDSVARRSVEMVGSIATYIGE